MEEGKKVAGEVVGQTEGALRATRCYISGTPKSPGRPRLVGEAGASPLAATIIAGRQAHTSSRFL